MKTFKLDQHPKIDSGFKVPEAYFDDFDNKILTQLPHKKTRIISLYQKPYIWLSGISALFIISFSVIMLQYNTSNNPILNVEYLSIHENLSTEDLTEMLTEKDIQALERSFSSIKLETKNTAIENL